MAEENCEFWDLVCTGKESVSEALTGAAGDALDQIADGVTAGVVDTIASLGSMWTTVGSANLTSQSSIYPAQRYRTLAVRALRAVMLVSDKRFAAHSASI